MSVVRRPTYVEHRSPEKKARILECRTSLSYEKFFFTAGDIDMPAIQAKLKLVGTNRDQTQLSHTRPRQSEPDPSLLSCSPPHVNIIHGRDPNASLHLTSEYSPNFLTLIWPHSPQLSIHSYGDFRRIYPGTNALETSADENFILSSLLSYDSLVFPSSCEFSSRPCEG